MKSNQKLISLVITVSLFSQAHANVALFHPGKHKTDVSSMKEDIEHNREQIFTDGVELNSLKMKVNDQESKINFNKQQSDEHKKDIDNNKNNINTNKGKIEEQQKEINNNGLNLFFDEINIKENQNEILANTKDIANNNKKISDASGLISENTKKITQLNINQQRFETKTERKFSAMDKRIGDNHHKAMAGVSSAMSMSAIPFVEGKRFSFGFGAGSYGGQGATALGTKIKLTPNLNVSAYGSYDSSSSIGVAAGISFGW
ncbi:YadA-like family protein [Pantoea sp. EA-12]|uniref:YadA C-terminal domain-containing protein n=1 Tax=Pantoea sp. EA-12 TaxID=3043303 RepID=UPI0024B5658B|nr:YadA-like family protein [Pantoea sp. EA-12]MDI9222081.1 YadA-like family protein [Pantoea sp. EA-12]